MYINDITNWLDGQGYPYTISGNKSIKIEGFSSLENYQRGTLTWVKKQKNYDDVNDDLDIRCAIVQTGIKVKAQCCIHSGLSKEIFFKVLEYFWSGTKPERKIENTAIIGEEVKIGNNVSIGNNCVINGEIAIGDNTIIEDNVVIMNRVKIGASCRIHAGCVIGKDGFSITENSVPEHIRHFGGVFIGDRVEIGANCVIDRGTIDHTRIGDDTKIDSLTLVAHNSVIGSKVMIIGGIIVGGSCRIGDKSYVSPGAMIKNQVKIGVNSFVGMGVYVHEDLEDSHALLQNASKPIKMRDYRRFL